MRGNKSLHQCDCRVGEQPVSRHECLFRLPLAHICSDRHECDAKSEWTRRERGFWWVRGVRVWRGGRPDSSKSSSMAPVWEISDIRTSLNILGNHRWMGKNVWTIRSGHLRPIWWTALEFPLQMPMRSFPLLFLVNLTIKPAHGARALSIARYLRSTISHAIYLYRRC